MSTRSNIIIKCGKTNIIIYRHCDGYLEGAGKDLYDVLATSKFSPKDHDQYNIAKFISKLLISDHSYRIDDQLAGDIEYLYIFDFTDTYEHGEHYNRVKLKSITVDQDHKYGNGGKVKYKSLKDFNDAIYEQIKKVA